MPDGVGLMAVPLVLIEDNETAGQAVQATLKRSDEFVLQAWYRTGKEALSGVAGDGAGLVVLDLGLPDVHGLELIPQLRRLAPDVRIVAHTIFDDPALILRTVAAGANGYLLKDTPPDLFLAELKVMHLGGAPMSAGIARKILRTMESGDARPIEVDRSGLSDREIEVLNLISLGFTYRDAADEIDLSEHTLRRHIENIYRKLDVHRKSEAILKGRRLGIIRVPEP